MRKKVGDTVSELASDLLARDQWPEVLPALMERVQSGQPQVRARRRAAPAAGLCSSAGSGIGGSCQCARWLGGGEAAALTAYSAGSAPHSIS